MAQAPGVITLLGCVITLVGIGVAAKAGATKEAEMSEVPLLLLHPFQRLRCL